MLVEYILGFNLIPICALHSNNTIYFPDLLEIQIENVYK